MNLNVTRIMLQIEKIVKESDPELREPSALRKRISACIGAVIGMYLELPSSKILTNVDEFYLNHCYPKVMQGVSDINESYGLDIDTTLYTAKSIWRDRYNLVFGELTALPQLMNRVILLREQDNQITNDEDYQALRTISHNEDNLLGNLVTILRSDLSQQV